MILCLGTTPAVQRSMQFDRLSIDAVNRTAHVQQYASGKSVNAARVLQTLGADVFCTGFVGGDTGQFLLSDLDDAGISHCFVRVEPATRLCITLMDNSARTATELIEEAHALPAHAYTQLLAKFNERLAAIDQVILSGSLPAGAPADFYADCVSAAVTARKFVLLDATGEPLRRALGSRPTVIKPNRQELAQTAGAPTDTDDQTKSAIRQLLSMGPQWAVVTNGSQPTIASDGQNFWKIFTPAVAVVSAIGSGDSFAAGLTAAVASGKTIPEACAHAAACGSANAMTDRAGHLKKSDVDRLLECIEVEQF